MADIAGEVSTTLGGLSSNVDGVVDNRIPYIDTPDGWVSPSVVATIFTRHESTAGDDADVQLQVSAVESFSSVLYDTDVTQPDGASQGRPVSGLVDGQTYFLRARVKKNTGASLYVSPWTPVISISVSAKSGIATENVTMNVGMEFVPDTRWLAYSYMNVSMKFIPESTWLAYAYMNVGVARTSVDFVPQYVFVGDVTNATPDPVIWFLMPSYGRANDGISIYGFGFGDLQTTYNGVVEIDRGGTEGWTPVPVVSWQTRPPTPEAYSAVRQIDETVGYLDPQHTVIEITLPADAIPPGYPVRVRTEGP